MKILAVHAGGGIGGAPISLLHLLSSLPPDFEPSVAFTASGPIVGVARSMGLRTLVVPARAAFFYSAHAKLHPRTLLPLALEWRRSVRLAEDLLSAERPDVLHLNTSVLLPFAAAAARRRVPVLWQVREVLGPNAWIRAWHSRLLCRGADLVVATSEAVRERLACADRVEVVPNAVDLHQFRPELRQDRAVIRAELGVPDSATAVAILGSVQRAKGHWVLLDALERAQRSLPDLRVVVVAGGAPPSYGGTWRGNIKRALGLPMDSLDALRRDARRRGLEHALLVTGFRTDVPRILAACDGLVFPSLHAEGFGRPLIEGMAMRLPVVGTDVGPTREIIGSELAGLIVPPGDADALAAAVVRVLKDQEFAEQLGRAGRERVERLFSLPLQVQRFVELYRRVAASREAERATSACGKLPAPEASQ